MTSIVAMTVIPTSTGSYIPGDTQQSVPVKRLMGPMAVPVEVGRTGLLEVTARMQGQELQEAVVAGEGTAERRGSGGWTLLVSTWRWCCRELEEKEEQVDC